MNGMIEASKMLYAFIEYVGKKKGEVKKDVLDFIGYYAKNYDKYDKMFGKMIDDKELFIKMCEWRGFSRVAKDLGISRQAARKRYIKYGGNKRFKKIGKK
jgi:hypothetical protein